MPVESINFISDFVTTNPLADDPLRETDDHIKAIKLGIKNTFPGITGPVNATQAELNRLVGLLGNILTTGTPRPGQLVLLASVTVTAAATVDLINGTGGVVIDANYDEYVLEVDGVSPVSTADLRLQLSTDGGATWAGISSGSTVTQYQNISGGTATAGQLSGVAYFPLTGTLTVTGSSGVPNNYPSVRAVLLQTISGLSTLGPIRSEMVTGAGRTSYGVAMRNNNSVFNAIRLLWSTGNFQALGSVRLWGRRFT